MQPPKKTDNNRPDMPSDDVLRYVLTAIECRKFYWEDAAEACRKSRARDPSLSESEEAHARRIVSALDEAKRWLFDEIECRRYGR